MRLRRGRRRPYVSRAELVLARPDTDPLGELGLKPDPLQAFALALGRVRDDLGEDAAVVIDVMPASGGQQRRLRRRLDRRAQRDAKKRQQANGPGVFDGMMGEGARSTRATSAQTVHQRSDVRHLWTKIGEDQPLFRVQILIRAESEIKGRAEAHVKALETCFRQFAGKNHWRVAGWRIPGVVFFGADSWWRRAYFDRRFRTAIFRPAKRSVVNAGEIGGLLKPPTAHCKAPGVVRAGAAVAAPPRDLPAYRYRPGVLPLGEVMRDDQLVTVGMDIDEFFFGGLFGRSRFGKALALDTPIPTPSGWRTMGELREGDRVFDETGAPCTVTAATEVMHNRECFEVVFSDGARIVADAEHRWLTMDAAARAASAGRELWTTLTGSARSSAVVDVRHSLAEISYAHAGTRVLERWTGGGDLTYVIGPEPLAASQLAAVRTTAEIAASIRDAGGQPNHTIGVAGPLQYDSPAAITDPWAAGEQLAASDATHIPTAYLRADVWDRSALLTGLLRGAGVDEHDGFTVFTCASRQLAHDVHELVVGLGMTATLQLDDAASRHAVRWTHEPGLRLPCTPRAIIEVRPVTSVPVRCIAVDAPSHLYLAGRACIPTHNTELALVQFVHAAVIERAGALFFDPHQDAIARVKPYLSDVADRVIEINLARRGMDSTHVAWNLLSMEGLGLERLAERAAAVIDSFAVGAGWSGRSAGRTMAILSNAVYSLLYLALRLPGELQPTIFTLPRFLIDEDWREATIRYLPEHLQRYWLTTYASYPGDAAGPLCQLISRLQTNPVVAATFGSPRSTYNPRRAMDQRSIILMCPPSGKEHLVTNLLMQGHIDAARSRADLPPEQRSLAYWWMDEAPAFDRATENAGTSSLAEVLEQCAKYGIRAMPMSQSPHRLSDSTIEALTTNASLLITTATSPKGARFFGDQWEAMDAKRAVQQLERFHYIGQPTHHGRRVEPFRIAGISMDTFWGERKHPERIKQLEAAIDETCRPMTVAATLDLIDGHDERILQHIVGGGRKQPATAPPLSAPAGGPPVSGRDVPVANVAGTGDEAGDVVAEGADVAPAAAPAQAALPEQLLGGLTIKRRRRTAAPAEASGPDTGSEPGAPATLPVAPAPATAPEPERASGNGGARDVADDGRSPATGAPGPERATGHELVDIDVDVDAAAPDDAPPRPRLAPLLRTSSSPGGSPLLESLAEDRERIRRRGRERDDG